MAEVLKQYVLYTYANTANRENFNEDYFVVDEQHVYEFEKLNKKLFIDGNDVIYDDGYIIVPSIAVRDGLLYYLKTKLLNDTPGVLAMKDKITMENYYHTVSDFRNVGDQLIFVNKNGLLRWKAESFTLRSDYKVSGYPLETTREPYYYRNPAIRKEFLMIVQNVEGGEWERALMVALKWRQNRINIGYHASSTHEINDLSWIIYTEMGQLDQQVTKGQNPLHVLQYENGQYAAILFFV